MISHDPAHRSSALKIATPPWRVAVVVGTRPEAIKLAPVVRALRARPDVFDTVLVSTAQHRELLSQTLAVFGLVPDVDLALMRHDQPLADFAARCLAALGVTLQALAPSAVLVQGDTTTAMVAALAGVYQRCLVGHVEAGLRTHERGDPFPEELNRRLATVLTDLHFAPTERARRNLLREGIADADVVVTGNPIVDALRMLPADGPFETPGLDPLVGPGQRLLLLTVHRRENHGLRLSAICAAARRIVESTPDVVLLVPLHPNPHVQAIARPALADVPRIRLVAPLPYGDLLRVLACAHLVLTDSGGLQEEAPSFRVPVLILRDSTERPECVEAGVAQLVGADPERIVRAAGLLLRNPAAHERMRRAPNPFGDGRAATRIVDALQARLEERRRPMRVSRPAVRGRRGGA